MSPLEEINAQHVTGMAALVRRLEHGQVIAEPGVLLASGGVAWPVANAALLTAPVAEQAGLERRIDAAATHFSRRKLQWTFFLCEDWLEPSLRARAPEIFAARGLSAASTMTGMLAEELAPPGRLLPSLEYRRVADHETRCALADINSISYGVPLGWGRELLDNAGLWDGRFPGFVGYADGTAVTAAAAGLIGHALYVGWVATLPPHRQRGCAEAAVRHALLERRRATGVARTTLHASPAGLPLYQRIGYRAVANYTVYFSG